MTNVERRRATNMAEFGEFGGRIFQPAQIGAAIMGYRPQPTDVIISPFAKCGTTWLQQIFHTLRTGGDMDFDDISRVVPWIETATALELDLNGPQRAEPRGFKSHLPYAATPKGARYIVSVRDPRDAVFSFYKFMEGWFFEPGTVAVEDFVQVRLEGDPSADYWGHLLGWWAMRDDPSVLLFSYEQMVAEPERSIRRVAAFCGIPLDDDLLALTLERSSIAFMLEHKDRFDDAMLRRLSENLCNLPSGSDSAKVRQGGSGGRDRQLPDSIIAALDKLWAERVAPVTGFADYAALDAALRARS